MRFHLLLTGPPRVGKTTLVENSVKYLSRSFKLDGFITKEIREKGIRKGFEIIKLDGEKKILSHKSFKNLPKVGSYGVKVENLEEIIEKIDEKNCDILIVDEIGKMELLSRKFFAWVMNLLTKEKPRILGTIGEKVLNQLERENDFSNCKIIRVNYSNRRYLLSEILKFFKS